MLARIRHVCAFWNLNTHLQYRRPLCGMSKYICTTSRLHICDQIGCSLKPWKSLASITLDITKKCFPGLWNSNEWHNFYPEMEKSRNRSNRSPEFHSHVDNPEGKWVCDIKLKHTFAIQKSRAHQPVNNTKHKKGKIKFFGVV